MINAAEKLLDVGGTPGFKAEFQRLYDSFATVVRVNLRVDRSMSPRKVLWVAGDGRALPFKSHSFDWVFSNAVIEHVGGLDRQELFASESRRVARKGYFVATPNRRFPIEPHLSTSSCPRLPSVRSSAARLVTCASMRR
jgi:ubiquinone/menaquinone biosynthesis C-methylase UbiE